MNAASNPILRDLVLQILNEYVPAKSEPFTGHRIGSLFRHTFPEAIYSTDIVNPAKYLIVGSVGQGQWATVPWVCIFDRKITTTATHGIYIVYLLAKDGNALYLTLNQGCTGIRTSHSKNETIQIMRQRAEEIRSGIDTLDFSSDDRIDLGSGLTELAELYQKGTILYKAYLKRNVPDEATLRTDLIKMMQIYSTYSSKQQANIFDSWEVIDARTIVKCCDKSFFNHNGSGIPKELHWFFGADTLTPGAKKPIDLRFGVDMFQGRVVVENSNVCRVRVFWAPNLGNLFKKYETKQGVLARFQKVGESTYSVTIKESGGNWLPSVDMPCVAASVPLVLFEAEDVTVDSNENRLSVAAEKKVSLTLEEKLREALKTESARNKFGATLLYLRLAVKHDNLNTVKMILQNANWARSRYGRYHYVDDASLETTETIEKAGVSEDFSILGTQAPRKEIGIVQEDEIIKLIKDSGLNYIDRREQHGTLWVIANEDIKDFIKLYKTRGYTFRFAASGARSTEFRSAWYLVPTEFVSSVKAVSEVDELLHGEIFEPLRTLLARIGITTVDALKALKLWPLMIQYNLYDIGTRMTIEAMVQEILNARPVVSDDQLYVLRINKAIFKGTTASNTYQHFCDDMARKFPLQFRNLIGLRMNGGDHIPVRKSADEGLCLKLENTNAYVSADLSIKTILLYVRWICALCKEKIVSFTMDEPQKCVGKSTPHPHLTPAPIVDPIAPKVCPTVTLNTAKKANLLIAEIERLVQNTEMAGVSYDDIKDTIHETMVYTKQLVSQAIHIVEVKGKLFHENSFIDWKVGADRLDSIIDRLMPRYNGYISGNLLYEYARTEMNMFLNDNDMNDERAVYDIAQHLFDKVGYNGKHYMFSGNAHISRSEDAINSTLDIAKRFAKEQAGPFPFKALVEYFESVGVNTSNIRNQMRLLSEPIFFYCNEGMLIAAEDMHINNVWTLSMKKSLDALFYDVGDHIILREIPAAWYERLPALPNGFPWTPLLLQGVLRFYSDDLGAHTILAMEGQGIETLHSMLVQNDSPIQCFGDVVVSHLLENDIKQRDFEAEELRCELVAAGIIHGNELIWNMPKALRNDARFAWDAVGNHVTVKVE